MGELWSMNTSSHLVLVLVGCIVSALITILVHFCSCLITIITKITIITIITFIINHKLAIINRPN